MAHSTTPHSTSPSINSNVKKDWHAHKEQSTTAQAALAKKKTKNPYTGPGTK